MLCGFIIGTGFLHDGLHESSSPVSFSLLYTLIRFSSVLASFTLGFFFFFFLNELSPGYWCCISAIKFLPSISKPVQSLLFLSTWHELFLLALCRKKERKKRNHNVIRGWSSSASFVLTCVCSCLCMSYFYRLLVCFSLLTAESVSGLTLSY